MVVPPMPSSVPASTAGFSSQSIVLERLVDRGLRRRRRLRAQAAFGVATGLSALWLLAFATGAFGSPNSLRRAVALSGAGGIALAAAAFVALKRREAALELAAALRVEDPTTRSVLRSAIELRGAGGDGFSPSLVEAHASWAAERAGSLNLGRLLPGRGAALLALLGIAVALLDLVLAVAGPARLRDGFAALARPPTAARVSASREPITGDVELTLLYPAHTHLPPRAIAGTNGEVSAPAGTEVRLRTRADRDVRSAVVVVNGTTVPLTLSGTRELSGAFLVSRAGGYFFRFLDARGRTVAEGPAVPISIDVDAPPQVTISAPKDRIEVDAHEVVTIHYDASDDYGLSEIALLFHAPGDPKEERVSLRRPDDAPRRIAGDALLDLGRLHLSPGDRVTYSIEAVDNDAVSGPKSGRARAQTLSIFSEAEHHREALAQARALWNRLILVLADRIDEQSARDGSGQLETSGGDASDARALALCDDMERGARLLRKDRAAPLAIARAISNVSRSERARASATSDARGFGLHSFRRFGARAARPFEAALDDEIAGLERDVLYLEALLDRQTMLDLVSLSKELQSRRRELSELMERYRRAPTAELRARVQAELARLEERVAELMSRMSELAKGLSDEHLNQEALARLQKNQDVATGLKGVEKALARGDVDSAQKQLDELGSALDQMERQLSRGVGRPGERYPELARQVRDLQRDLGHLADDEKQVASKTEAIRSRYRKAAEAQAPASAKRIERLRGDVAKAKAALGAVPEAILPPGLFGEDPLGTAKEKTQDLDRALGSHDLDQALRSARQAAQSSRGAEAQISREQQLAADGALGASPGGSSPPALDLAGHRLGEARALLEGVRDQIEKLFPKDDQLLSPSDQRKLEELSKRQQTLQGQLGQVRQEIRKLQDQAPIFDPSARQQLEEAGSQMGQAQRSLAARQPGKASESEQGALRQLDSLRRSLDQGQKGASGGGGFPMPFASSGPGEESPDGEGGEGAEDREKVVIPGADQYRVPPEFRQDVLDAMKQKAPPQYEDQVKKYYQEIVR